MKSKRRGSHSSVGFFNRTRARDKDSDTQRVLNYHIGRQLLALWGCLMAFIYGGLVGCDLRELRVLRLESIEVR